MTDAVGNTQDDSDFCPFGKECYVVASSSGNPYKFTGKERDIESGLDDFGARYYSSQYGRFMTPDWSAIPVPVPYANLTNPQTLNLYAIVHDNPETFADLDGHFSIDWVIRLIKGKPPVPPPPPPPPPPSRQGSQQDQNQNQTQQARPQPGPAPKNPDGTPKAPNIEPPKDVNGNPTKWKDIPGSGPWGGKRWIPDGDVPSPDGKGGKPDVIWDPEDGYWTHHDGGGNTTHWDPETGQQIIKATAVGAAAVGTGAVILDVIEAVGVAGLAF